MSGSFYDVVVMGMEPGPLAAGALLARRGFRVLVTGQGASRDDYTCRDYRFCRRPFLLTGTFSPAISRVMEELGATRAFSSRQEDPPLRYQVILTDARVDICADPAVTRSHLEREIPSTRGQVDDVLRGIGRLSADFEKLAGADLVIPPESFFEQRAYSRALVQNPFMGDPRADVFDRLGVDGNLRRVLESPVLFDTASTRVSPLVASRQMGAWLFDCRPLKGGRDGLRRLLLERIGGLGGDVQDQQRVSGILVDRGKVRGVRLAGREHTTGARIVLSSLLPRELGAMVEPGEWTQGFRERVSTPVPVRRGYAVNLGVRAPAVPEAMGRTAFLRDADGFSEHLIRVEQTAREEGRVSLNVSCLLNEGDDHRIASGSLRDALLDRLRAVMPYLDSHLEVVHSPFDAVGPVDLTGAGIGRGDAPAPFHPDDVPVWRRVPPTLRGELGMENLTHRTGIKGLLLCGDQVVSGLGTEGEFIAAWGAAEIAGRMDPSRQKVVRAMRGKTDV